MRYVGLIVVYLGVLINTIILWKCYSKIDLKLRINNKFVNILIIFVFSILLFCIDLYVPMKFKIFIIYPLLSTMFLILYKDKTINVFFKSFLVYAILNVCDYLISDKMYEEFNNFETKIYYKVCKIMGILIDNAVEASINSKEKTLLIYIYEQCNGNIVISIENSYNTLLDIHDINKKGYSTKGKNRGLGLFIANRTIEEEKLLRLRQYVFDKTFISELKIIKECNLAEEDQEDAK